MRKTSILHLQMQEKESPHPELVEGRTADLQPFSPIARIACEEPTGGQVSTLC
jgi:hypothetical protein